MFNLAARLCEQTVDWFGRGVSLLLVPLVLCVCLTVTTSYFEWVIDIDFERSYPLLGRGISVNTFVDGQWYIFAFVAMIGIAYTLNEDRHVRVDLFSQLLSRRVNLAIQLFGNVLFLLPFAVLMIWFSWKFVLISYRAGEGSTYGGLASHWVVKSSVLIGFALLALSGISDTVRKAQAILGSGRD